MLMAATSVMMANADDRDGFDDDEFDGDGNTDDQCKNPIYIKPCPPPRSGGAAGPLTENGIRRGSALSKPGATARLLQLMVAPADA